MLAQSRNRDRQPALRPRPGTSARDQRPLFGPSTGSWPVEHASLTVVHMTTPSPTRAEAARRRHAAETPAERRDLTAGRFRISGAADIRVERG